MAEQENYNPGAAENCLGCAVGCLVVPFFIALMGTVVSEGTFIPNIASYIKVLTSQNEIVESSSSPAPSLINPGENIVIYSPAASAQP